MWYYGKLWFCYPVKMVQDSPFFFFLHTLIKFWVGEEDKLPVCNGSCVPILVESDSSLGANTKWNLYL